MSKSKKRNFNFFRFFPRPAKVAIGETKYWSGDIQISFCSSILSFLFMFICIQIKGQE